ncbi:MAG: methylase, partial [Clostridia bacterium]|nr:methylase [Clostridia bacterium]
DFGDTVKVHIGQFYGIEINDFAVSVAKTALWIAEHQMLKETAEILERNIDFLPLKTYANIVEGNALRIDWETVVPKEKLNYIMGNPPFVAKSARVSAELSHSVGMQSDSQKEEKELLFGKAGGVLDYVACWFKKAAIFMENTEIQTAFVSTNSICQGEQIAPLWKELCKKGIQINFAHKSFKWKTEAVKSATVFVIVVGFSYCNKGVKTIFQGDSKKTVENINAYLVEADNVFIDKRTKPLCDVAEMHQGSKVTDDGNFIYTEAEYLDFISRYPETKNLFRKFMMGKDFIDRKPRYCLWLVGANISNIRKNKYIMERIEAVRNFRLNSSKAATRKKAETPMLFDENQQPETNYIALPEVSSGNRKYIPIDFMTPEIVVGNKLRIVENATLYEFGMLTSNVHMAWMRATCGYYGPSYQYSINIVYNNFPWPTPTEAQKLKIERTAQAILDARALYPDSSLADLYDELTMPPELRKAHQLNDKAVMEAYGFWGKLNSEAECVSELIKMYQELTK